jgi:uncharacterized protein (TIGR04255 family)
MPFPDSPRVIYTNNSLEQVICQVRFPPILRIDAEIPARYQDAIRQQYPLFEEKHEDKPDIPKQLLEQLPPDFLRLLSASDKKAYNFISIDEQWTVSLTRDFIALTANNYSRWEEFKEHFRIPFDALLSEYAPALFSRVGLRYQNVIRRSVLGLESTPWSELIQPYIAGPLAAPGLDDDSIVNTTNTVEIRLRNEYGRVRIRYGFAVDSATKETCYLIDSDFFAEKIKGSENVLDRLDRFNRRAGRLFRWCITPHLHEAMGPRNI